MIIEVKLRAFYKGQDDLDIVPVTSTFITVPDGDVRPYDIVIGVEMLREAGRQLMVTPMSDDEIARYVATERALKDKQFSGE